MLFGSAPQISRFISLSSGKSGERYKTLPTALHIACSEVSIEILGATLE
jgi:hypothetical protein